MLIFKITSYRTVEVENEKKFVAYLLKVHQTADDPEDSDLPHPDPDPVSVERRYTHFLDLYNGLKKEEPALLSTISFPRKMMIGNFDPSLIESRCAEFQSLLSLIASESRLRDVPAVMAFFQNIELQEAKKYMNEKAYDMALTVLESSFKLLNKVYTDRSRLVLSSLCRIVACASLRGGELAGPSERWAQLALKRYETVCDTDLLLLYVPLLHTCISIWETLGKDKSKLVEELNELRKHGMKVDSVPSLMEAVDALDTAHAPLSLFLTYGSGTGEVTLNCLYSSRAAPIPQEQNQLSARAIDICT